MAKRLTVFGGSGALVPHIVAKAREDGYKVQVLAFAPQPHYRHVRVIRADAGKPFWIVLWTRLFRTSHIVMAGGIILTERQREILAGFGGAGRRNGSAPALGDAALSGIGKVLKTVTGADLIGVHDLMPELLAPEGLIAGPAIAPERMTDLDFALATAREIGRLDIGQAAVTSGRHVIAVEDVAGTDSLIARVGNYLKDGIVGNGSAPLVLAKAVKPQQTMAIDLPAVGPDTITNAAASGIRIVALDAGAVLLLDRDRIAMLADELGVSVIGRPRG